MAIDLRSDTVTQPCLAMKQAMMAAPLGDDVYGEDPSVEALQRKAAELLAKQAALFVSSGTQSNLLAMLSHCARGDEYIAGMDAHTYKYEAGGAAVLGGIQPQPIVFEADGSLDLDKVAAVLKPDDAHFANSRLLCLENTQGGKVLSPAYCQQASTFAQQKGLLLHLDGARLFNAAAQLQVPVAQMASGFDSVSICLSKGLGAPVGSLLLGSADFIKRAHRWRKMLGGGMRQAGMLAAAGSFALDNNVNRLSQDHQHARQLAQALCDIAPLAIEPQQCQTNMLFINAKPDYLQALQKHLATVDIIIGGGRWVTHLDINADDITRIISAVKAFKG